MSERSLKAPVPPAQLWGLWVTGEPHYPEGYWLNHIHGPKQLRDSAPMTFVSRKDAEDTAVVQGRDHEEIVVALIGVAPPEGE